jgi:hypothetical protein
MQTRANCIRKASESVLDKQSLLDKYQSWFTNELSLSAGASDGLQQAIDLRAAQAILSRALESEEQKIRLKQRNKVKIRIVNVLNLPCISKRSCIFSVNVDFSTRDRPVRWLEIRPIIPYTRHRYPRAHDIEVLDPVEFPAR